jgi:hypothetical protein
MSTIVSAWTETTLSNYLTETIAELELQVELVGGGLPDPLLTRFYALLVLTTGEATTLEHVHDAWSSWRAFSDRPEHSDLVWFSQLPDGTADWDTPYRDAIVATARIVDARRAAERV